MKKIYLVTGASGHLGTTLCSQLLDEGKTVRALALPGEEKYVPSGVETITGDVTNPASLTDFFHHDEDEEITVLHCAGIVTIASGSNPMVHKVNVEGTRNILRLAQEQGALKVVYVCSVHGLVEAEEGDTKETPSYFPEQIDDQYGKSKAEAANIAFPDEAEKDS